MQKESQKIKKNKKIYSWLERGSDERQYNAPGLELDIAGFSKSKYGKFKEYHTSADKLNTVVTETGLKQSYNF